MVGLTEKQQEVLKFIQEKQETSGMSPTFREIAAHFGFRSPNAALAHVQALQAKGVLKSLPGRARSVQAVTTPRRRVVSVPLYGAIPAGVPRPGIQEEEGCILMDIETLRIKPSARTFALKVQGDSMIGKHIIDGDVVIIEHGVEPRSGDVVAALIDGQVTLKTFVIQRGRPYLRAENPAYPKLIPQEELQIQGVMIALVRNRQ